MATLGILFEYFWGIRLSFLSNMPTQGTLFCISVLLFYIYLRHFLLNFITDIKISAYVLLAIFFGFLGSKLNFWLFNIHKPFFSTEGFTFMGGAIFVFFFSFFFTKKYLSVVNTSIFFDTIAPYVSLSYGLLRLGCHLSGDGDWGIVNLKSQPSFWLLPNWTWAYNYPYNVLSKGIRLPNCEGQYCYVLKNPVYPTSFYEFLFFITFFCFLKFIKTKHQFSAFIYFYCFVRFFIGFIRDSPRYTLFELSEAQIFCIFAVISYFLFNKKVFRLIF